MVEANELGGLAGAFVVLDGVDGSGKTTVQRLVADSLTRAGLSVTTCKDPGGTEIGNRIRSVLLDHDLTNMSLACETLLFMASRAQLVAEVIEPALANGHVVLCDRYVSSTCAYQGAIGADTHRIIDLANYATGGTWPDLTVVIDIPVEVGFQRIGRRANGGKTPPPDAKADGTLDAMERRPTSFHERVRQNFLALPDFYPAQVVTIDGTVSPEQVAQAVLRELACHGRGRRGERSRAGVRVAGHQASGGGNVRWPAGNERCRGHVRGCCLALLIGWGLAAGSLRPALAGTVQHVSLDGEWRHWLDQSSYEPITVPFSVKPIGSVESYQRLFDIPAGTPTQRVLLYFDGMVGQTQVYLNGVLLGGHGSYTPFWFDVTSLLDPLGQNDLAVVIDDRQDNSTIPYADIPWVNYSGIIRHVELICGEAAILLASRPQYVLTADLGHVDGTVTVEAFATPGVRVYFTGALLRGTPDHWTVVASMAPTTADADLTTGIATSSLTFALDSPDLWSPETPNRYSLYVVAGVDGALADERLVATGFRSVSTAGKDVLLNNQPLLLKGVSYHGIYAGTGFVATDAQIRDDLVRLKSAGANYVRTVHYPHDPRVLDIADEIGLLISEEVPAWANFWDPVIQQGLYDMLTEMIHRDMHHPSIFLWISGNARAWPMPYAKDAQNLIKSLDHNRLASYVIDNDEYDPGTIAQDVAFFNDAGLDLYMKISWWFYYVEYLQDAWANFPKDIPIVISEFGREGDDREPIVVDGDQEYWLGEEQQADAVTEMLEAWRPHLPQYDADEHLAGLIYFNYEDLDWPDIVRYLPNHVPSIHHGLVYADRQPKQILGVLGDFYSTLPDHFVGLPAPEDQEVERRFDNPVDLGSSINKAYRDSGPSLSAHGDVLYFASDGPDYVGLPRIFFSRRAGDGWTAPELVDMPQESEQFAFRTSPCISYDGQTLFFTRAMVSGIYVAQTRIWRSHEVEGAWTDPQDLGDVVNYPDAARVTSDPSISADGNTLFFSSDRPGGFGRTDIWMSRRVTGEWTAPENLGPTINTSAGESEPSISADGRTLHLSSDRSGGVGSSDIWVTHLVGSTWTIPKNLGPELNSPGADREPEGSKDGRYLLFTGIRSGGAGLSDVWVGRSISAAADFDHDGDLDQVDFAHFQACFSGPSVPQTGPECLDTDLDGDGDTDADDLTIFADCASGPAIPADPSCGSRPF